MLHEEVRPLEKEKNKSKTHSSVLTGIGLILCIVFGLMFLCNMVIIIKGTIHPETPPSVAGITPMVVLSGSMSGSAEDHIEVGDLIFVGKADADKLKEGDIIAFQEENSITVVTHRIIKVQTGADSQKEFITKGDANNTEDQMPVPASGVIGQYRFRIAGVGNFAIFLQTPLGMILFIGVPVLLFIIYDIIRRQKYANRERKKSEEMEAELERLRKLAGEKGNAEK